MMKIDIHTVETLQLLSPGVSRKDSNRAKGLVLGGIVFSDFSKSEHEDIWKKLCKGKVVVPTLHTFFRDTQYLEACANCVKRLVVLSKRRPTVRSAMKDIFKPFDHGSQAYLIQTSETDFRQELGTLAERFEFGYRQLWLYAMRHYPKMAKDTSALLAKPNSEKADEIVTYEMAILARQLGFDSPQIQELIEQSPDRQIAQTALLKARKPDRYQYDSEILERLINLIVECFSQAIPVRQPTEPSVGQTNKPKDRCGLPHSWAQQPVFLLLTNYMRTKYRPVKMSPRCS